MTVVSTVRRRTVRVMWVTVASDVWMLVESGVRRAAD